MMSDHGANPIFFDEKKDWTSRYYPPPPTSNNISFLPYSHPNQNGHHMYITPKAKQNYDDEMTLT